MAQAVYRVPHVTRATALSPPLRFIAATSVFDGHDAAIHIIRRLLQDHGAEVVYLGHNRGVDEIVAAALQEDADAIAVSSYQGGHMEFFTCLVERLRAHGAEHVRIFAGGGGTITEDEARALEAAGVTHVYSPEEGRRLGLTGVVDDAIRRTPRIAHLVPPLFIAPHDYYAIGRWLTLIEAAAVGQEEWPQARGTAPAPVIGITGTGGAGKSSLMDELLARCLRAYPDITIAVLANDPTSVKSGGALLGDRIRLNSLDDPRIYMRSLATRRANLATSVALGDCIAFLRGVGFGLVFVETAGTGQSDTEIDAMVDLSVYVMTADYGSPSQLEKIQMLDLADVVALNKADHVGAADAVREISTELRRRRAAGETPGVVATVAAHAHDPGVDQLFGEIARRLVALDNGNDRRFEHAALSGKPAAPLAPIVPRDRLGYLGEIAATGRAANGLVERRAQSAARAQSYYESLVVLGDTRLPKPLQHYPEDLEAGDGPLGKLRRNYDDALNEMGEELCAMLRSYPQQCANVESEEHVYRVRGEDRHGPNFVETVSGTRVPLVVAPHFTGWGDLARFLMKENLPGHYPYTAGVFPFHRQDEDPARMFAGEGGPERTNRRFHYLARGNGAVRLSTAFDPPTLYGEDPDERPDAIGRVGMSGVSIATLDDMKKLYSGFDLAAERTSVSMTINGPAPAMLALFLNTAIDQAIEKHLHETGRWHTVEELLRKQRQARPPAYEGELPDGHTGLGLGLLGVSGARLVSADTYAAISTDILARVRGTLQADLLKEEQAQNECLFPLEFGLKIMGDVQEYAISNCMRNYYCVSVSGYHIAEAGANPITQLAFTLANGFTLLEHFRARGMAVDDVASHLSFFFSNALDPEYAVIERVARRIWARALREVYGSGPRAQLLKSHIQTSGRSLQTRDIAFNDVRTTLEALYAIADNCSSLHTNAYDEAVTTPTEESVRRALAIQQILQREFGLFVNQNPFQGSFTIERLTDLVEEAVYIEFDRLSERGGVPGAMELRYQRAKIQEESMEYERRRQDGRLPVVGVNTFVSGEPSQPPKILTRTSDAERQVRVKTVRAFKQAHIEESGPALECLKRVVASGGNIFAELMETVRCCTLGEITHALYDVGGRYRRSL